MPTRSETAVSIRWLLVAAATASADTSCGRASNNAIATAADNADTASVLEFHHHANRDGFFVDSALTFAAAAGMRIDPAFDGSVQGNVYASPLYVEHGPNGRGAFYLVTEDNEVDALDEQTGLPLWKASMGTAAQRSGAGCGNVSPIGITGTPAIDLATRLIVFDAATGDGAGNILTHTIVALSIDDGRKRWAVDVAKVRDPSGRAFSPQAQNQRGAVLIVGTIAYVAYGGHAGDCGTYQGWLVGVRLDDPTNAIAYATSANGAGLWAPGGPASDGASIFAISGNSIGGGSAWAGGEGVYRFPADLTFSNKDVDYWVPPNWSQLDAYDVDLGGSGPLVVDAPAMAPSGLLVALGKDGNAYVLDRADLGGIGAAAIASETVTSGRIINAAAWASVQSGTYIVLHSSEGGTGTRCPSGTSGDLVALKLDPSEPGGIATVWCRDNLGQGSPIITTSDGEHDAIVWTAGAEASDQLHGWDLETGEPVFAGGAPSDRIPSVRRFTTPIVAHGRILVGGDNRLFAFRSARSR